jgi:hypothetical protein
LVELAPGTGLLRGSREVRVLLDMENIFGIHLNGVQHCSLVQRIVSIQESFFLGTLLEPFLYSHERGLTFVYPIYSCLLCLPPDGASVRTVRAGTFLPPMLESRHAQIGPLHRAHPLLIVRPDILASSSYRWCDILKYSIFGGGHRIIIPSAALNLLSHQVCF